MSSLWTLLVLLPDRLSLLPRACEAVSDWEGMLAEADREGVLGLVAWGLREIGWRLPEPADGWVRQRILGVAMQQLQARATLKAVTEALEHAGIRSVPFKGPMLAETYYPPGALRPCGDLDILIDPSNRERAEEVLRGLGYMVEEPSKWGRFERFRHEVQAKMPGAFGLELHQNVNASLGVPVPTGGFLDRATFANTSVGRLRKPTLPDCLMTVALHAAISLFLRAKWLMDVKMICVAATDHQIQRALTLAKEHRVESAVVFALEEAERVGARVGPLPERWRIRHGLARKLRPAVATATERGKLSPMPVVHLVLSDEPAVWPALMAFRVWNHVGRRKGF
jgi:hypothetical protein